MAHSQTDMLEVEGLILRTMFRILRTMFRPHRRVCSSEQCAPLIRTVVGPIPRPRSPAHGIPERYGGVRRPLVGAAVRVGVLDLAAGRREPAQQQ